MTVILAIVYSATVLLILMILLVIREGTSAREVLGMKPKPCRHDWDMKFHDGSLDCYYKCSKCKKTRQDMPSVYELMGL